MTKTLTNDELIQLIRGLEDNKEDPEARAALLSRLKGTLAPGEIDYLDPLHARISALGIREIGAHWAKGKTDDAVFLDDPVCPVCGHDHAESQLEVGADGYEEYREGFADAKVLAVTHVQINWPCEDGAVAGGLEPLDTHVEAHDWSGGPGVVFDCRNPECRALLRFKREEDL